MMPAPESLIRPLVQKLNAYVPGEQPKIPGLIKLNTNEKPYPPSPKVIKAIQAAVDERLRLYPNPTAQPLREKLARFHGCKPEHIIVGNGSDELLAMAVRAFVNPLAGTVGPRMAWLSSLECSRATVQYFTPSYSLYPVLANIHGARPNGIALETDFRLPSLYMLKRGCLWDFQAALTLITTPNAPTGRGYRTEELARLCRHQQGVVVLDETYADFAEESALALALAQPNVIVSRSFSKAYSLCFQRVGYFIGHPELIAALDRIRDSYNVNGLGQVAALATLEDLPYYRAKFRRIIATRERVTRALTELGFEVCPSQTNFLFVRPPALSAKTWLEKLRERRILVRWWDDAQVRECLRITVGTDEEMDALLRAAKAILAKA